MNDIQWVRQQMCLRKLANQFLANAKACAAKRVLITSLKKGDGKAIFIGALASEMVRVKQELVPLAAENLQMVSPDRFGDRLAVVYGPSYFDMNGLHTIPDHWMRAFDAAVIMVMTWDTRARDLVALVHWLKEYGVENIWPVLNEFKAPALSRFWPRIKARFGFGKSGRYPGKRNSVSLWKPILAPLSEEVPEETPLPLVTNKKQPFLQKGRQPLSFAAPPLSARKPEDWGPPNKVIAPRGKE
jgi:hypothetical protein